MCGPMRMPPASSSRASARSACATSKAARAARRSRCAAREVILSGGTYNSPQVLQLSGVGAPELLGSLGIEVRHALSGVGEGLQDHYAPRSVARVKNISTINELRRGVSLWVEALKWATTRRGLLSLSPTMVYCFWHSGETTESSDL